METYLTTLKHIFQHGTDRRDRTNTGTRSVFGSQMRFSLSEGFPLLTTKKVFMKGVIHELLWFLSGSTHIGYLQENGVHIWDEWADSQGNLGPVYGHQWRSWQTSQGQTIDQIKQLLQNLKTHPESRRHIVSAWNVGELQHMALPPCHLLFQFYIANNKLSCSLYQRSCDMFLGVPFNIASYSLLTHMIAQQTQLDVGEFIWNGGDCHIYHNHFDAVTTQLDRQPLPLSTLTLNSATSLFDYTAKDIIIDNYNHHPAIKAPIAV